MADFLVIPAIDLMDGQVVRLRRGEAEQKTVYSEDPAAVAVGFEAAGARRIHVVDLDGAFKGERKNHEALGAIRAAVSCEVETGGGLRTEADVADVLKLGADFAILGTSAVRDRDLVKRLVLRFGEKIIVGIDARDGKVAVEGWTETSELDQMEFARELEAIGVRTVIATDIATDGMMVGPNLESLAALADAAKLDVIASGGVRSVPDLQAIRKLGRANLVGAITGRAVYEGGINVAEAVRACAGEGDVGP